MKAITILQPWASAIACGAKRIETRSWRTDYRGPLAIHAGASLLYDTHPDRFPLGVDGNRWLAAHEGLSVRRQAGIAECNELPRGALIAVAELVACTPTSSIMQDFAYRIYRAKGYPDNGLLKRAIPVLMGINHESELALGDFHDGRYGWVLRNVRALPEPVPCRGRHGLWTPPADVLAQVEAQR